MKTILTLGAALAFLIGVTTAHAAIYVKMPDVDGESAARATTTTATSVQLATTTSSSTAGGNVEFEWKVEEGESAGPALLEIDTIKGESTEKKGKESGEKGGTEDINIGVGELQEAKVNKVDAITVKQGAVKGEDVVQYNESDWDFLKKNPVAASAVEVRGWDPKKKEEFLASVKEHAEVQSGQDLDNFAKGVLLENESIEELSLNFEKIVVKHRANGKFFGFIPFSFTEEVEVDTEGENAGRVKVKFPWFSFLMKADVSPAEIEADMVAGNEKWLKGGGSVNDGDNENWNFGAYASLLSSVSNVLKTKHDTAKNSIGNIR